METVAGNKKRKLVLDEDSPLSTKPKRGKSSLSQIKADEATLESGRKLKKFSCKHVGCGYATAYSKDLKRHLRIHSGEQPYQCGICKKRFNRSDKMRIHERLHSGLKSYRCTKCKFTTNDCRSFKKHNCSHADEVPYRSECPTLTGACQYFVVNVNPETVPLLSLPSEESVMSTEPPLKANSETAKRAEITTRRSILAPSNSDQSDPGRLKKFACDYTDCQFISAYKKDLTRHLRIHSGELPFECEICKRRFSRSDKLRLHERSHSGGTSHPPKLKKFICHHVDCHYASAYRKDLRRHIRVHSGGNPFQCRVCKRRFKRPDTLKLHEQFHIADEHAGSDCNGLKKSLDIQSNESCSSVSMDAVLQPFMPYTEKTVGNKEQNSLPDEAQTFVSMDVPQPLLPCGKTAETIGNKEQDSSSDDAKTLLVIPKVIECLTNTAGAPILKPAKADCPSKRLTEKKFVCYYSGCTFASAYQKDLTRHFRIHSGEQPFECATCNKKFYRSDKLRLHQQARSCKKTNFCCEKCGYNTCDVKIFKKHLSKHSTGKNCSLNQETVNSLPCGKPTAKANIGEQNMMPHEDTQVPSSLLAVRHGTLSARRPIIKPENGKGDFGEPKRHACHYAGCQYVSAYKKDLVRHLRIHSGEKPYECDMCGRKFNRSDKLRLHERTHTGEKPYKCDKCDYASVDGSSLRIHSRIHTEEKTYRCEICPYTCRFLTRFSAHMKNHTVAAAYSCKHCQCKFTVDTELKQHERLHTEDEQFECTACDYKCILRGNLKVHFRLKNSNKQMCDRRSCSTSSKKTPRKNMISHDMKQFPCSHSGCSFNGKSQQALGLHFLTHCNGKQPS